MRSIKNGDGTPTNLYGVVKGAVDFPDKFYVPENYALDTTPVTIPTSGECWAGPCLQQQGPHRPNQALMQHASCNIETCLKRQELLNCIADR